MTKQEERVEAFARASLSNRKPKKEESKVWAPDLNPTQEKIFFDDARFIYAHGPRGTGKGFACLHKILKHSYENPGAFTLIVTRTARQGSGGLKDDIERQVIPEWIDGIGLNVIPFKMDGLTKDWTMWVEAAEDAPGEPSSRVVLMSAPHSQLIEEKVKALSPSMVFIDELTEFDSPDVIMHLGQQLGRRAGINGPQQLVAAMNPKGEGHWAYKLLFIDPVDEETGEHDPNISVYQVPISENKDRLPEGYYEKQIIPLLRNSKIDYERLVNGKWIDKPSQRAILGPFLKEEHIIGDIYKGTGLKPVVGHPVIVGMDPGTKWTGVSYMQLLYRKDKSPFWIIFDELALSDYHTHKYLAKRITMKMDKWDKKMNHAYKYIFISDSSALNQFRSGEDRYDAVALIRHSKGRIPSVHGVNKPSGSKKMRVSVLQDLLATDSIYVSATCEAHIDMFRYLESDKKDPDIPKRQENTRIHIFDSLTYPLYKYEVKPSFDPSAKKDPPTLIAVGSKG